jgi:hypothetical protein
MDEAIKWALLLLPPLLTLAVAIIGLRAWYWQLVAKRRFEVAEQAMTVFAGASDALSGIRSRASFGVEEERVKVPEYYDDDERRVRRKYGIYFDRADDRAEAFKSIRLTQVLCELHISKKAADALEVLFRVRHHALAAAHMLMMDDPALYPGEDTERRNARMQRICKYEHDLLENRGTDENPMATDRLSQQLNAARASLEAECKPLLREQTLLEFLWTRPKSIGE